MVIGTEGLAAAIFIYKKDGSETNAWCSIKKIGETQGAIRGELHQSKSSFIPALKAWNSLVNPCNSFLCIYSHAGESGMAPVSNPDASDFVKWSELADALSRGVSNLWLLGCKTHCAHSAWAARPPIAHHCLSTLESANWQPFIKFFAQEISMDPILSPKELMSRLKKDAELAGWTSYSTNEKWVSC